MEVITRLYAEFAQSNMAHARMVDLWFFSVDMYVIEAAKIAKSTVYESGNVKKGNPAKKIIRIPWVWFCFN